MNKNEEAGTAPCAVPANLLPGRSATMAKSSSKSTNNTYIHP